MAQTHGSILPCINTLGWLWWCNEVVLFSLGPLVPTEDH